MELINKRYFRFPQKKNHFTDSLQTLLRSDLIGCTLYDLVIGEPEGFLLDARERFSLRYCLF